MECSGAQRINEQKESIPIIICWAMASRGRSATQQATLAANPKAKNKGSLKPYLRNTNVHWFSVRLHDSKSMPFEDDELAEYELRAGGVLPHQENLP